MAKEKTTLEPLQLAHALVQSIEDKKGENILLMDIAGQSIFADYFVIANGTSERHLRALADAVSDIADQTLKRRQVLRRVGEQAESGWILLDLGAVVVHLFSPEQRKYYNLEGLWKEARVLLRVQ